MLLSVMRRIFASGFRAGFDLSFRWIPSELNSSDKGSRLFDRDYDPNKSLLDFQNTVFTSTDWRPRLFVPWCAWVLVKLTLHLMSMCTGHAAAVSSFGSSITQK